MGASKWRGDTGRALSNDGTRLDCHLAHGYLRAVLRTAHALPTCRCGGARTLRRRRAGCRQRQRSRHLRRRNAGGVRDAVIRLLGTGGGRGGGILRLARDPARPHDGLPASAADREPPQRPVRRGAARQRRGLPALAVPVRSDLGAERLDCRHHRVAGRPHSRRAGDQRNPDAEHLRRPARLPPGVSRRPVARVRTGPDLRAHRAPEAGLRLPADGVPAGMGQHRARLRRGADRRRRRRGPQARRLRNPSRAGCADGLQRPRTDRKPDVQQPASRRLLLRHRARRGRYGRGLLAAAPRGAPRRRRPHHRHARRHPLRSLGVRRRAGGPVPGAMAAWTTGPRCSMWAARTRPACRAG